MNQSLGMPEGTPDNGRIEKVREAIRVWKGHLIDFGARNRLLYYRDLRVGTLDLTEADESAGEDLLAGKTVRLSRLFPDPTSHEDARRRAHAIRKKAQELEEERGIETCFLAVGIATWESPKGTAIPAAPVVLRQAAVRPRGAAHEDYDLVLTGDAEVNPTLLHVLNKDFRLSLDGEHLAELSDDRGGPTPSPVFERLEKETKGRVPGFAVNPRHVLGTFSYAKLPMVADLDSAATALAANRLVAAIAGDRAAQETVRSHDGGADPDLRSPDHIPPADEFLILDADSSQNYAINAVLAGRDLVIQGPPGTGKSQTIANLIATLVARGRRVLFVAEKRAAITAVTSRLDRRGLGNLVMDVHGGTTARSRIAAELRTTLESASRTVLPDQEDLQRDLKQRRTRLNDYATALHMPRESWQISVFAAQSELIGLRNRFGDTITTRTRLVDDVLRSLDRETARRVADEMHEYASLGGLTLTPEQSLWAGAKVRTPKQAEQAYRLAGNLVRQTLPNTNNLLEQVIRETGLKRPRSLQNWQKALSLLDAVAATLRRFTPDVFASSLPELVAACAPRKWRRQNPAISGAKTGWWRRRALRRQARMLWRNNGRPSRQELFTALHSADEQVQRWNRLSVDGERPRLPTVLSEAESSYQDLSTELRALGAYLQTVNLEDLSTDEIEPTVDRLASDETTLRKLPRLNELATGFRQLGLDPLLDEMRKRALDPDQATAMFWYCWYASILDTIRFHDSRIGLFDGALHSRQVTGYRSDDARHITATAARVRRAVAEHIIRAREAHPEQSRLVERQANLKRRHMATRTLFTNAPELLTALKPCWAMSPLVVSQLLPPRRCFDVVIFDEASQVTPADAVPAILRGGQLVVTGDKHQLPPTDFFTTVDDEPDDDPDPNGEIDTSLVSGYESILNVLDSLLSNCTLRWHYRSQDERLIGFSNAHIYDRALVTFPGIAGARCLTHELVEQPPGTDQRQSVTAEVERVVQLMLDHARGRPDESLGVIAMNLKHADRIDVALRRALTEHPELQAYFDETRTEPYFVKNLERVQGDERDAIILSIGYGKDATGRLPYRFGPLLREGGERRLNVAVTRARRRMTLVSAFSAADMDPNRSSAKGVRLLGEYLRYAESGGTDLGSAADRPELNPFEIDVRDRLTAAGIPLIAQYGVAGYHIDFAASHPQRPGELVLAIEADGASYHSSPTARDRDRLRQEHLERLGWTFHRIWSTDWFTDPDECVARAVAAYQAAVAAADTRHADSVQKRLTRPARLGEGSTPEPDGDPGARAPSSGRARTLPRPGLAPGQPITAYHHRELVALIRWFESDTLLRTEEEVLREVMRELGFRKRGSRITAAVSAALRDARQVDSLRPR